MNLPARSVAAGSGWQWNAALFGCAVLLAGKPAMCCVVYLVAALAQLTAQTSAGAVEFLHGERLLLALRIGALWVGLAAGYAVARRAERQQMRYALVAAMLALLGEALLGQVAPGPLTLDPWSLATMPVAVLLGAFLGSPARGDESQALTRF